MKTKLSAPFNNMHWSKADHDLMVALLKDGKTYIQIAKCLGRSVKAIEQHAYSTRTKLKQSGLSQKQVNELIPTNFPPRKTNTPYNKTSTPTPEVTKDEPLIYSGGALFDRRVGDLLIACSACAVGIWMLVGIFIASLF